MFILRGIFKVQAFPEPSIVRTGSSADATLPPGGFSSAEGGLLVLAVRWLHAVTLPLGISQ